MQLDLAKLNPFTNPFYYSAVFELLIFKFEESYRTWLNADYIRFYETYAKLNPSEKLLLARCHFRQGEYIRFEALNYSEIENLPQAYEGLIAKKLLRPAELSESALAQLKAPELKALAKELQLGATSSLKKDELLAILFDQITLEQWQRFNVQEKFLPELTDIAKVFFFGDFQSDVFDFIKTDVLKLSLEKFESQFELAFQFKTQQEFNAALDFFSLRSEMYEIFNQTEPDTTAINEMLVVFEKIKNLEITESRLAERRSKYYYKIGHFLEQNSYDDEAESKSYQVLALSQDCRAEQKCLTHWLRQSNLTLIQEFFAENKDRVFNDPKWNKFLPLFLKRAKKIGFELEVVSDSELPTDTYELKKDGHVEDNLCRHFEAQGLKAYHLENYSVRSLFVLYFWDIIFTSIPGAFRHQFQAGPDDFFNKDQFYQNRKELCDQRLAHIASGAITADTIVQRLIEKKDFINPLAQLSWLEPELLSDIVTGLSGNQLAGIFKCFLKDIRTFSAGFPDLVVIDQQQKICRFVEVKGPGDTLRPVQIEWLKNLISSQIDARVARVVYV